MFLEPCTSNPAQLIIIFFLSQIFSRFFFDCQSIFVNREFFLDPLVTFKFFLLERCLLNLPPIKPEAPVIKIFNSILPFYFFHKALFFFFCFFYYSLSLCRWLSVSRPGSLGSSGGLPGSISRCSKAELSKAKRTTARLSKAKLSKTLLSKARPSNAQLSKA